MPWKESTTLSAPDALARTKDGDKGIRAACSQRQFDLFRQLAQVPLVAQGGKSRRRSNFVSYVEVEETSRRHRRHARV